MLKKPPFTVNECLSGRSNYWGKPSAGTTYPGSYLQGQEHLHGGLSDNSHSPKRLFAAWVNFLLVRRASSSRGQWCPWCPASHIPVGAAPTSTAPAWDLWLTWDKPKPAAMQAPKKAQLWPSNTTWRNHGRQEKGWQTHSSEPGLWPHPARHWIPDLCSCCTAPLSRASRRAAASLPAEHQLLPLPGLFGIPSLPRETVIS